MYTFILIMVVVSIISACFFKKNFWENRYIILAIIAGVALIATLSINFVTRNDNPKVVKTIWVKDSQRFNLEGSLVDSNFVAIVDSLSLDDFAPKNDTIQSYYLIYKYDDEYRIAFTTDDVRERPLDNIIIRDSGNDKAYYAKERVYYGNRNSPWVTELSLPHIKTYRCLYVPHNDYVRLVSTGLINNEKS